MASTATDLERIYRRHAGDVYRFALSVVRNPLEAEDVTQTTFLNAFRALERGDRPERPRSWLLAIAHNAIRSRDRWTFRRPQEVPLDLAEHRLSASADEPPPVADLLRALAELPEAQREALALRELQGQTYPEIAEVLGISVSAVESLIGRARRALRAQRDRIGAIAVLRRLCEQGDGGAGGVVAKASVAAAAAAALVGGMAVETHVAGPPRNAGAATSRPSVPAVVARTTAHRVSRAAASQPRPVRATPPAAPTSKGMTVPPAAAPSPPTSAPAAASASTTASAAVQSVGTTSTVPAATTATTAVDDVLSAPTAVTVPAATVPAVTTPVATTPALTTPTVTLPPLPSP